MLVRYLPVILLLSTLALALAPIEAASQTLGSGIRTEGTPSDREAHNGAYDRKHKVVVTVGDVSPARASPPDREPRPKTSGAPVNSSSEEKPVPPGTDLRQVRPAQAFPPDRIERTPQAPSRGGVDTAAPAPKEDPRGVEERKDPEP